MAFAAEHDAVRKVVIDYLEGMIYGDEAKLRRAFHPQALQVGHYAGNYEFFPFEDFLASLRTEEKLSAGSPYIAELISVDVTGTVAIAKVTDTCFGSDFTDYLMLVKDRLTPDGRWQIVTKTFHVHSGRGLPPAQAE